MGTAKRGMGGVWIAAILLLAAMQGGAANWVRLTSTKQGGMTVYADPDSLQVRGGTVYAWILYSGMKRNDDVRSMRLQHEFDCDASRVRTLYSELYSAPMAQGSPSKFVDGKKLVWTNIKPNDKKSVGAKLLEAICRQM